MLLVLKELFIFLISNKVKSWIIKWSNFSYGFNSYVYVNKQSFSYLFLGIKQLKAYGIIIDYTLGINIKLLLELLKLSALYQVSV